MLGGLIKFLVLLLALAVGNVVYKMYKTEPIEVPPDTWWGPGDPSKQDSSIKPFKIDIPEKTLEDLRTRLKNARPFTPPLEGIQQQYGMNTKLLQKIVDFWLTKYNWREREVFLNQYPQYKTNIQGLDVHYIHVKPSKVPPNTRVVPLLLLHGWPGSVREFYEIIPLLTTAQKGKDFVFEVIVPSLPGYGFTQAAVRPGLGVAQAAVLFKNLMRRLGFDRFYVQGGDWGSAITEQMALYYPQFVKGIHRNMCMSNHPVTNLRLLVGSVWPSLVVDKKYQHKMYPLSGFFSNLLLEMGYMHLQATKPDTVGVGLNDSPVGLAAYIIEKFTTWTNPEWKNREDGGLTEKFTYTQLLDNVMIYWVTQSITTSVRFYAESLNGNQSPMKGANHVVQVPAACATFEHEIMYQTPAMLRDSHANLVHISEISNGGHFAAFEVPQVLAEDIWTAIGKMEQPATTAKESS